MNLHIGNIIDQYLRGKRIKRAYLARLMKISYPALLKYQANESIQTKRLLEISQHLKHNFFMDIAMLLPPEYTTAQNPTAERDLRIAQLEEEVKLLKTEKELLLKVLGK